jgi:hypothetical protein
MTSPFDARRHGRALSPGMRGSAALAIACLALVALALAYVLGTARAETAAAQSFIAEAAPAVPAALSRPIQLEAQGAPEWQSAAFRGLSCSRCNSATQYCVLNPIRYEYACAPLGSVACISASRTHWCPASRGCWAGRCR